MPDFHISCTKDLESIAQMILSKQYPKTVVLKGDLGAGKTTFVRTFVSLLDEDIIVSSPTFTLMNIYETDNTLIHHFDLYRLSTPEEAFEWGFDEFVTQGNFVFVEWAERAMEAIPRPYTLINIHHGDDINSRTLTIEIIKK